MTYVLVVANIFILVLMFIAAFWGFTYPRIMVDGYESGKSAYVAAFMCFISGICLCGLNFHNYYLLVTYAVLHLMVMLNQVFILLPFNWTRIPNYPFIGSLKTQVYILLLPKILLVSFALAVAYHMRLKERRFKMSNSGGMHHRLPCHIVPRPEPHSQAASLTSGTMFGATECQAYGATDYTGHGLNGNHVLSGQGAPHSLRMISSGPGTSLLAPPPPPISTLPSAPATATNQIVQTPPIYPLHRPSVTDLSINSPNRPSLPMSHRPSMPHGNCPPTSAHHPPPQCPPPLGSSQHSRSCGGGLNGIGIYQETDSLARTRSSGMHQWHQSTSPYDPSETPTKWWPTANAKQQQYRPYYRDVYNPNF